VYVHIGLPKTGTSYLQHVLWHNQATLEASGVFVPGEHHQFQRRAVWDLMGRRLEDVDQPHVSGSWQALVEAVHAQAAPTTLVSEEFLVHARKPQVRRIVRDLSPADVHAVVTVRDLGRALGSMWHHEVSQGATWSWAEFLTSVRDPEQGPPSAGVGFWMRYDLDRVLRLWGELLPADRIHVVVVPPAGSPPDDLLRLYATAVGFDASHLEAAHTPTNTSVGVVETELMRRLNTTLGDRLNERQRLRVVERALKPALRTRQSSSRLEVPAEYHPWLVEQGRDQAARLRSSAYPVYGDLADLSPTLTGGVDPSIVPDHDLLEAAVAGLGAVSEHYAEFWWRVRRRKDAEDVSALTQLASTRRAWSYQAKARAFALADRNRFAARAARWYLRRQ